MWKPVFLRDEVISLVVSNLLSIFAIRKEKEMNKLQHLFSKKGADHKQATAFATSHKRVENRNWPDMLGAWIMDEEDPKPELWLHLKHLSIRDGRGVSLPGWKRFARKTEGKSNSCSVK
jgi:hypothetical protein